jgi:radical SAM protein with 4Fe4S-binding SPASM domain
VDCAQNTWPTNREYLERFNRKVARERIPLSGSLDLTHRCNLRCVHCYLGDKAGLAESPNKEIPTDRWMNVIDDITEAGCLYLVFSGGEPLLRKGFSEIYSHARRNGLLVTVFTNGTLISDRILEVFEDLPPYAVEISLYGATASTYERITGVKGSFQRCLNGIQALLDHQVNLRLKTILMTHNDHEFYDMKNMAKAYGVKFRFDAAIFPCFNGDKAPIRLRVSPKGAIEKEFSDEKRWREWKDFLERFENVSITDNLYQCGAGLAMFHVDPYGSLRPCVMVNDPQYDLRSGSFHAGWHEVIPEIREKKADAASACSQCDKRMLCGYCPPFFKLEKGAEDVCSEYLCAIGQYRLEAIQQTVF